VSSNLTIYNIFFAINLRDKYYIYKNLINYLIIKQDHSASFSKKSVGVYYKNINFEIKLYLIGLSFNRLIFNFDKILFILCTITNFLYFLSFQSPRVLFLGDFNIGLLSVFEKFAKKAGQLFYKNIILPGSVTNIKMVELFYDGAGKPKFTKHLDCIFAFFCVPTAQILSEIKSFCIPIIALIEFDAKKLKDITYPVVCPQQYYTIYFFIKFFVKILNSQKFSIKLKFLMYRKKKIFANKYIKKYVNNKRFFFNKTIIKKKIFNKNFFLFNRYFYFLNRNIILYLTKNSASEANIIDPKDSISKREDRLYYTYRLKKFPPHFRKKFSNSFLNNQIKPKKKMYLIDYLRNSTTKKGICLYKKILKI